MEQENLQQAEELNNNEPISPDTLNDETQNEVSVQGQPTPIEKAPEKEVPVWDFSSFNTDEIISHMKSLIDDFPVQRLKVLDSLPQVFEAQYQKEYDKALADFTKDGSPAETFDYQDNSKERFYSVYRTYREKKSEYYKKLEGEKEQNLKEKLQIIEELKDLIQHEESLNKTYQDFRNLQDRWRNTGMVPQAQANDLLETYHHHVENFFNYIKINKELRDLDLKKNLDAKNALIEQANALLEDNNIGNAFRQLQSLHSQWKEIGPVAKDVTDCATILEAISSYDKKDSTSVQRKDLDFTSALVKDVKGMKIGIPKDYFGEGLDSEVKDAIFKAAEVLKQKGAIVEEFDLSLVEYAIPAYYVIASAEASSNLSRFDGVKYGYRTEEYEGLHNMYKKSRSEGFGPEVKRRIMLGSFVLSSGYYDAYYLKALRTKALIKKAFDRAFEKYDVILSPAAPTTAPKIGDSLSDPLKMYLGDIYTISVNLAGLPGMTVPCGMDKNGLPIGLQLIADCFNEKKMIQTAYTYEQAKEAE